MADNKMSEMIKASLESVGRVGDVSSIFGQPYVTSSGVTVIPVSKISLGFLGAGVDLDTKKTLSAQSFGGGSGTGISVTPVAFLTVNERSEVNLIPLSSSHNGTIERALDLISDSPEIIKKLKSSFGG